MITNYPADHPFAMFNSNRKPAPTPRLKGNITQDTLIFALRSLGPSTPRRVAEELGASSKYVSRNLITLWQDGLAIRAKTLEGGEGKQKRATFIYTLTERLQ